MMMLHYTIAAVPIAIYLMLIGSLHCRRRPLVTSGWRDQLTLGIACLGLVAIGPMQLFFPMRAAAVIPTLSWILMFALYFMSLILIMLWSKPRLIVYGMTAANFREALVDAARTVDNQSNWYGQVLTMPQSGIQLVVEPSTAKRVNLVASVHRLHDLSAWHALEKELVKRGHQSVSPPSRSGWLLVGMGVVLLFVAIAPVIFHPETAYAELKSLLLR